MYYQYKLLRILHNKIKAWMIHQINPISQSQFLDIACGRGGDIQKWHAQSLKNVIGLDIDPHYIHEAKRRNAQLSSSRSYDTNNYKFYVIRPDEDIPAYLHNNRLQHKFDNVSCQFAIHYFFESESKIRALLHQVSSMLYTGGHFIVTAMNGDRVLSLLGPDGRYKSDCMILECDTVHQELHFSQELRVHIAGTLYFGDVSFSHEYIVKPDTLQILCQEYKLSLVHHQPFKTFQSMFNIHLDPQTSMCSELYDAYIFQRVKE